MPPKKSTPAKSPSRGRSKSPAPRRTPSSRAKSPAAKKTPTKRAASPKPNASKAKTSPKESVKAKPVIRKALSMVSILNRPQAEE